MTSHRLVIALSSLSLLASFPALAETTTLTCQVTSMSTASNLDRGPHSEPVGDWTIAFDAESESVEIERGNLISLDREDQSRFQLSRVDVSPEMISFCLYAGGCEQAYGSPVQVSKTTIDRTTGQFHMHTTEKWGSVQVDYDYTGNCARQAPKPKPKF